MPKGVRRSAEPTGPKIIELLNSEPDRPWSSVEIRDRLGIDIGQMESSLRNLVKKGVLFVVSRGRYAARPITPPREAKIDVDVLREIVDSLPDQFTLRDVEARLPRKMGNVASMLNYMVEHGELHRAALSGGVFSKTPPAVAPLSVYDHLFAILRREPARVFELKVLRELTGAPVASHEVGRLTRDGRAQKVGYGLYQLAPGIDPLPPDTVLPPPVTRVGARRVTEAEQRRVVDYLLAHPGSSRVEVADALGIATGHLATLLNNYLLPSGRVVNVRDGLGPYAPDHLYADESKVDGADQSATGRGRFSK